MKLKYTLIALLLSAIGLLASSAFAQSFSGSDNFDAPGPAVNSEVWFSSPALTQVNGHAALSNPSTPGDSGSLVWPTFGKYDGNSHAYDWTATVSVTLHYDGANGAPSIGIFAAPAEGGFFGIMLRGGQPVGTTDIFSSYKASTSATNPNNFEVPFAHIGGLFGTMGVSTIGTSQLTNVTLRLSWNSAAGTLTSSYSYDGGAHFNEAATITVASALGVTPASGFYLKLYAQAGGVAHPADSIYFDNFRVVPGLPATIFSGSDDFNTSPLSTTNWGYQSHLHGNTNGTLSVANNRLNFTKEAGSDGSYIIGRNQQGAPNYVAPASFTTNWVMDMKVTNTLPSTAGQSSIIAFEITDSTHYYEFGLSATDGKYWFHVEDTGVNLVNATALGNTDVFLRMTWDASAQILSTYYSIDGSTYTLAHSFSPMTAWAGNDLDKGFWYEVFAVSNLPDAITAGSIYADDFRITAVPTPSFTGSDNFNSPPLSTEKWGYQGHLRGNTNGLLNVTTNRLDFTKDAGSNGSYIVGWNQLGGPGYITPESFTTNWAMDLKVTNTVASTSGDFTVVGFEITDSTHYYAFMLSSTNGGYWFHVEDTGANLVNPTVLGQTDVFLRMTWDATAKILKTYYSTDGKTYSLAHTFNPMTAWAGNDLNKGFWYEVFANSSLPGAITLGSVYADNFSLSAVPAPLAPSFTTQPATQTATAGDNASFTVAASGTPAPTLQWQVSADGGSTWSNLSDTEAYSGTKTETLQLTGATAVMTGYQYRAVATNPLASATSNAATLIVTPRDFGGTYFGTVPSGGNWALYVRPDNTATYIAYLPSRGSVIVVTFTVNPNGTFTATGTEILPLTGTVNGLALGGPEDPVRKAKVDNSFTLTGQIGVNGAVTGQFTGLGNVAITGAVDPATGPVSGLAGLYSASALGTESGATYTVVGASGQAVVVTTTPASVGGAAATVNTSGQLTATTSNNAQLSLTIDASNEAVTASVTPAGSSTPITFSGLPDTVTATGYLANLSVRAAMVTGQTLIVGLVVDGGAKPMLVRAAGPVLNKYGLTGVVDPRLALYNGGTLVASNDNWEASLAATFATLGAFPFDDASKDAALLQSINGPHTAQAMATGPGAILVEAYDAGPNDGRKLVNLSTRFQVGTGDNILIAGFVLAGTGTKQVLIRAVGPTLASYGVTGTLVDPQLSIFDGGTALASNDNWSSTLTPTFDTVGAFHLLDASKDAALIITLQAGKAYTAQVSGVGGGTGEALIEVYLVP